MAARAAEPPVSEILRAFLRGAEALMKCSALGLLPLLIFLIGLAELLILMLFLRDGMTGSFVPGAARFLSRAG